MAYNPNTKVQTEHALMDEVVYQSKIILRSIILKNSKKADEFETEISIEESDYFIACKNGSMDLSFFPLTEKMLIEYGYSPSQAILYCNNRDLIPESDRDSLLKFLVDYYINHYEEKNDYYRMLAGYPEYGTTKYDIYLDPTDPLLKEDEWGMEFDFSVPIHLYSLKQINTLKTLGIMDKYISEHVHDSHYSYLKYLGGVSIDPYTARMANNWDILYIPNVEMLVKDRFCEIYNTNKEIYLRRTYQTAYSFMSDYYDEMVMIMVLAQTFTDMIAELPEWYIRRDIFDMRSVKYFLESQGVKFFKEIPIRFQIRIVKNLNRLIKYKSTNKNIHDILEIFGIEGTTVYKYYLYKDYLPADATGEEVQIDEYGNKFKLAFVKVPIDESYDRYIQDNMFLEDYDSVTLLDQYWDGGEDHTYIKSLHAKKDFSIEGTKYMFLDYNVDLKKYKFQMSYFLGMIFSSRVNIDDINIIIPTISDTNYYTLTDICILLMCLSGVYQNRTLYIYLPRDYDDEPEPWVMDDIYNFGEEGVDIISYDPSMGGKKFDFGYNYEVNPSIPTHRYDFLEESTDTNYKNPKMSLSSNTEERSNTLVDNSEYDWLRSNHPDFWLYNKWKIAGFNLDVDLAKLEKNISTRHSAFGFECGYTLSDFGVDKYIAENKISTVDRLNEIYNTNKECYDNLYDYIRYKADTRDKMVAASYVFDSLFLTDFDYEFYRLKNGEIATTYVDLLKDKNYSLYKFYIEIVKNPDVDVKKDTVRGILNDIITTLEYFIGNQDQLQYIFSFVPTSSFEAVINYISLMINFFKSWKVHFLDPTVTYTVADEVENKVDYNESINEIKYSFWKDDQMVGRDSMEIYVHTSLTDYDGGMNKEIINIYSHYEIDPIFDNVFDGFYSDTLFTDFVDADGGQPDNTNIPYYTVDAGHAIARLEDRDLDGGGVFDPLEPLYIDAYNVNDPKAHDVRNVDFSYATFDIDGKYPGAQWSKTFVTHITDTLEINNAVKLSYFKSNKIESKDDGLYLGSGFQFISIEDFNIFKNSFNDYFEYNFKSTKNNIDNLSLFSNIDLMKSRTQEELNNLFIIPEELLKEYETHEKENALKEEIHNKSTSLNEWFNDINPFAWELL